MQKKVLSEIDLYFGDVSMPEGFEINKKTLTNDILQFSFGEKEFPFSRTLDMLSTYIKEHINLNYDIKLIDKKIWGNIYNPNETSPPLLNINPIDLRNSPDYTLLYGVKVTDCDIKINYNDNKRKGKIWNIPLINNKFIMFPSSCMYYIINNQKNSLNFIQTITYESI
jgi:hypothetical protein